MTLCEKPRLDFNLVGLRALKEIKEGDVVFPGFGLPMEVISQYIPPELGVTLVSENGIIGHGPVITDAISWEPENANAGGIPVSILPGACFTSELDMFSIIRGKRRMDIAFLGAFEVSEKGDLANWKSLERDVAILGGAMDIAVGARRIVVIMAHTTTTGLPKIVKQCRQPITAKEVVDLILTDVAVIKVTASGLLLTEIAPGWSVDEVQALTEPNLLISDNLCTIEF